jgi:hypothetical protein
MRRWVEIEREGRTIGMFVTDGPAPARSALPLPYVISDTMEPTEQVDGQFYTSKSQFRAVGKSLGLIEVGNEKIQPRRRSTDDPAVRRRRKQVAKDAIDKVRAGHYERYFHRDGSRRAVSTDPGNDT